MRYLDTAILDATEWLCRKFQLATGRTNVWVAVQLTNLSIVVYFVWAAVYFWQTPVLSRLAVALFCAALLYALSQTLLKVPIEAYENAAFHRVTKGLRNPRRIRDSVLRASFVTLSIVLSYPILFLYLNSRAAVFPLTYSLIVLTTVVLYVLACDPLPPCAGRVREWLRGSAAAPAASPESTRRTKLRSVRRAADCLARLGCWTWLGNHFPAILRDTPSRASATRSDAARALAHVPPSEFAPEFIVRPVAPRL